MEPQLSARTIQLVAEVSSFDSREVKPASRLVEDLHLDSVGLLELIVAIEDEFGVLISDEDTRSIRTVAQLVDLLHFNLTGD